MRGIIIGGEQINAETCDEFLNIIKKYNCTKTVFIPAYGLTEATGMVSLHDNSEPIKKYYVNRVNIELGRKIEFSDDENRDFYWCLKAWK